jgi:hypothetical protein
MLKIISFYFTVQEAMQDPSNGAVRQSHAVHVFYPGRSVLVKVIGVKHRYFRRKFMMLFVAKQGLMAKEPMLRWFPYRKI